MNNLQELQKDIFLSSWESNVSPNTNKIFIMANIANHRVDGPQYVSYPKRNISSFYIEIKPFPFV